MKAEITSEQINAALIERLAKLNEVSEWGYITITVSGDAKDGPNIDIRASTRNTELTHQCRSLDKAIEIELAKHDGPEARKTEADKMRERAAELLKHAMALEAEALPA